MIEARFALQQGGFALDVDLRLPASGVSVLFGPSGCGKTTVLRCMAGLTRARAGRLVVGGQVWQDGPVFLPPHQRPIGMVFQEASLFPHLTVQGNLDYGRRRAGAAAAPRLLEEAIALLDIGALLQRRPEGLSGGERQRVAIARALAVGPRLLLMDEPLAALDARRKEEFLPYLERLHRALTIPVVYVTHAVPEVTRLADHLVLLEQGRVSASGALHELTSRLDVSLAQEPDAGVVLETEVAERDAAWALALHRFSGGSLWVRDSGQAVGSRARVRVSARDLSLALAPVEGSSVVNQLPGVIHAIAPDAHPAQALALVRVGAATGGEGGVLLMARLTRRSAQRLALAPGVPVWVQVKTVALLG